jgi:hypothetical protein
MSADALAEAIVVLAELAATALFGGERKQRERHGE